MIVKDEARCLDATLASLLPHFDDIVALDTDAADDGPGIARRDGARVFDFAWMCTASTLFSGMREMGGL